MKFARLAACLFAALIATTAPSYGPSSGGSGSGGITPPAGDISGTAADPLVVTSNGVAFGSAAFQPSSAFDAAGLAAAAKGFFTGQNGFLFSNGTTTTAYSTIPESSLSSIANNTFLGNFSGGVAPPSPEAPPGALAAISSGLLIDPRGYGAVCDGATWGSSGLPVQNGTDNDTAGFEAAAAVAVAKGGALLVPDGCWVSGLILPNGTTMVGASWAPTYGYDTGTNGQPYARPVLYVIGDPGQGINVTGRETQAFVGFEINAQSNSSAYGNTSCIGSTGGASGFGGKIWLYQMSFKGCAYGVQPTGGYVYLVSQNSDYGANNIGISGTFSDFLSQGDTFASGTVGIDFVSGNGAFIRLSNDRMEYLQNGIKVDNGGEISLDNVQIDHSSRCGINLDGTYHDINITGGGIRWSGVDGSLGITGAANNGSGLIRLTITGGDSPATSGLSTGDKITVANVNGTTEANGNWTITVIDGTHIDLQGSTFTNTYTSGGYGGVWGKDAAICLGATATSQGLHLNNVGFYNGTFVGSSVPAPMYIFEAETANNDYIELLSGIGQSIANTSQINYASYGLAPANWETYGVPAHYHIDTQGSPIFRNDTTTLSVNANGGVGIGTTSAATGAALDMSGETSALNSSMILPQGSTTNRPATPLTGMIRFNTTTASFEGYGGTAWGSLAGSLGTVATKTASYALLSGDAGTTFDNTGASGSITFTLPAAVAGYTACFYSDTAQTEIVAAASGNTIRNGSSVSASGGNFTSSGLIGSRLCVQGLNSTEWSVSQITGSWTVN